MAAVAPTSATAPLNLQLLVETVQLKYVRGVCALLFTLHFITFWPGDPRQRDVPVASLEAKDESAARDCWCVAFGNSYNDQERVVVAGYDNGDVKL